MKPIFARIIEGLDTRAYSTRAITRPIFSTEFHFHEACQMTYIVKSEGKRIIGDSVDRFHYDELTFLGSNIPHVWHNDKKDNEEEYAKSLALYIDPDALVDSCKKLFDIKKLESFLNLSKRGLLFYGASKENLKTKLYEIIDANEIKKSILLLEILELLIHTTEFHCLSSSGYTHNYQPEDTGRIDRVFKYVFDNFRDDILLDEVSEMCSMSKHAFCRYFKSRTQKTFIEFVHEVRVSEASKLIAINHDQINHIAYQCGFNSLSHFNKIFKQIKGVTPSQYKAEIFK